MSTGQSPRKRPGKGTFTTKSGNSITLNRSFSDRIRARKDLRARQRAAYLSTLPKNRWMRLLFRMHPKRVFHYWFSREGGIMALKILGVSIVAFFLLLVGTFAYFRRYLPNITDVSGNNQPGSNSYYDRSGKVLLFQDYSAEKRIPVPGDQISQYMKDATVAIEDKDFYHEGAFNIRGITRAATHDLFGGGSGGLQGGSTITQQLVKLNEDWTNDQTVTRKIKELILAVELGREYSKADILTGYLNVAPYGGIENGVQAAAEDYFHTSAADLTLAQSAMLAAIPQDPPYYSPYSDPTFNPGASADYFDQTALLNRQHYILDLMVKQGKITQPQADAAKKVDILAQVHPLQSKYHNIQAPYFVLAAKQELEDRFGTQTVNRGGWKITTTLNMNLQREAEHLVQQNLPNVENAGADEEAMAGEDIKTGQMVMLVGGVNFDNPDHGKINYAQINISPGSSFKPYDYTSLINYGKNVGAGSVLYDTRGALPGYDGTCPFDPYTSGATCPAGTEPYLYDYDNRFPGPETLRYALAGSRNVPAVKAMLTVGTNKVISTADALMGYPDAYKCFEPGVNVETATKSQEAPCYGASAIGDGAYIHLDQHVNGLSSLARFGAEIPQTYILQIQDASGKTTYQWTQPKPKQVVNQDSAYIVDDMASDPNATYLPGSCSTYTCSPLYYGYQNSPSGGFKFQRYNGWHIAVKTGTTNNGYDGLMTAWTTQYAVASWVAYHTRNVTLHSFMEYLTEPLTRPWIQYALDSLHMSPVNWRQPSDIKVEPAFIIPFHVGIGSIEPSRSTDIFPSWYIPPSGSTNVNQAIDKVSGKLATSCTPSLAREYITNSNAGTFSVDKWVPGGSAYNTTATDDVHNCGDARPTATLTVTSNDNSTNGGQVVCDSLAGCTIAVTVTQGTHPLASGKFPGQLSLKVGGKTVKTFQITSTDSPQTFTYSYKPKTAGSVTVDANVIDSVLYQAGSNSETISTSVTTQPDQGGNPPGDGNPGGGH